MCKTVYLNRMIDILKMALNIRVENVLLCTQKINMK